MKSYYDYINEDVFDLNDYKYFDFLLNKIKDGLPILIGNQGKDSIIFEYNKELKMLHDKIINKQPVDNLLKPDRNYAKIFKDKNSENYYPLSKIFKGQFSQVKKKDSFNINFSGGKNTKIGESIQVCGFFMDLDLTDNFKFNETSYKNFIKQINNKKLNLADPIGIIENYMSSEKDFINYSKSLFNILYASSLASKDLKRYLNFTGVIHNDINYFYSISRTKGFTDSKISKDNTADCVLYTGKNFLKNFENEKSVLDTSNYNVKIKIDGEVTNEFLQISLKSGGRLGDLSTFTSISNNHKYFMYESFSSYLLSLKNKTKKIFLNITKKFSQTFNYIMKSIKGIPKKHEQIAISLFNEGINENRQTLPKEHEIFEKYKDEDEFNNLKLKIHDGLHEIKNKLDSLGDGIIYNLPDFKIPNKPNAKEMRFLYFNAVSILTMKEYLETISKVSDFQTVEIEMIYGNTLLPLVKVFTDYQNPIEYLPISNDIKNKIESIPTFGFMFNVTKGGYLSFYIHILSTIHTNEPTYIKIQMRTKGSGQYVVDGQSLINYKQFAKAYN